MNSKIVVLNVLNLILIQVIHSWSLYSCISTDEFSLKIIFYLLIFFFGFSLCVFDLRSEPATVDFSMKVLLILSFFLVRVLGRFTIALPSIL